MKKTNLLKLLASATVALSLVACGTNTPSSESSPSNSSTPSESSKPVESTPESSSQVESNSSESSVVKEVEAPVVEATHLKLNLSNLETGDITTDVTVGNFKFYANNDTTEASSKKAMQVADLQTPVDIENGPIYTKVLKTQSASQTATDKVSRVIEFKTTGKGTVKLYAKSGNAEEERAIGLYNVENTIQHDSKKVLEADYYELTFHYAGTYYITSSANVSLYEIEASWQDGVNEVWPEEAAKNVITLSDPNGLILNAGDLGAAKYTETQTGGLFKVNAGTDDDTTSRSVTVDANSKSWDGVKYTQRIKLGGAGTIDYRSIGLTLTGEARVTFVCMSSNSSTDRQANLFKADGTAVGEAITVTGSALNGYVFVVEAGEYYFASLDGGVNIYGVIVEYLA